MDKKLALITLIEQSFFLPNEAKLALLGKVKGMSEEDVVKLGKFLSAEHAFVVKNEKLVKERTAAVVASLSAGDTAKEPVYYGKGNP